MKARLARSPQAHPFNPAARRDKSEASMRRLLVLFGVVAALTVVLSSACQPTCSANTCDGCCDDTGTCLSGLSRLACGEGGASCRACGGTDVCLSQACSAAPDGGVVDAGVTCHCGSSCCLADGTCAPGNLPEACGGQSQFCQACSPGQRCENATCVAGACAGCVDAVGTCVGGKVADACGTGGALCVACLTTESCSGGQCVSTTCTAQNCSSGCCSNGACVTSNASHCGLGGATCSICSTTQSCTGGRCL